LIGVAVILFLLVSGCTNYQASKRSQVEEVVAKLPDFQEQLYFFNISSGKSIDPLVNSPYLYDSYPRLKSIGKEIVFQIIYRTKNGGYCLVFLSGNLSPKIVEKIELK